MANSFNPATFLASMPLHELAVEEAAHRLLSPAGIGIEKIAREVRFGVHIATLEYVQNSGPRRVSHGKALDAEEAVVGALMEAVERSAAEQVSLPVVVGTFEELTARGN